VTFVVLNPYISLSDIVQRVEKMQFWGVAMETVFPLGLSTVLFREIWWHCQVDPRKIRGYGGK